MLYFMEVVIREAREDDLEDVAALSRLVLQDTWEKYARDYYPRRALDFDLSVHNPDNYRKKLANPDVVYFVAVVDGKIVGVAMCGVWGDSGLASLKWICVHPSYQRRGIGSLLMERIIDFCKRRGCHKITLYTMPVLRPAINFYLKFGFVPETLLRKHWWGVDFVVMSKML